MNHPWVLVDLGQPAQGDATAESSEGRGGRVGICAWLGLLSETPHVAYESSHAHVLNCIPFLFTADGCKPPGRKPHTAFEGRQKRLRNGPKPEPSRTSPRKKHKPMQLAVGWNAKTGANSRLFEARWLVESSDACPHCRFGVDAT